MDAYTALDMVRNYGDMTRIAEINSHQQEGEIQANKLQAGQHLGEAV